MVTISNQLANIVRPSVDHRLCWYRLRGGNINMYIPWKQVHDCGKFIFIYLMIIIVTFGHLWAIELHNRLFLTLGYRIYRCTSRLFQAVSTSCYHPRQQKLQLMRKFSCRTKHNGVNFRKIFVFMLLHSRVVILMEPFRQENLQICRENKGADQD
jgi:hypothetical protein